ncbi:MAG TPA: leucyl aminopeptidase [Solirubrobacteraceae bacterium]|nr:leucyl aminopeptidase [Solirubrobacteraceae bacterium]
MKVSATTQPAGQGAADTIAVGVWQDGTPSAAIAAEDLPQAAAELLASGEARGAPQALALAHADGRRWLLVGLGDRAELTPERLRVAAAAAQARALEIGTRDLCWAAPAAAASDAETSDAESLSLWAALVEGTLLADYRFDRHRSASAESADAAPKHLESLTISAPRADPQRLERGVAEATVVTEAANAARDLQNRPANDLTPTALAAHAQALAEQVPGLTVETEGREGIVSRGMGAFAAVAQGSEQEPALITLRYDGTGEGAADGRSGGGRSNPEVLGLVGKAVTFDSGGISLKPGAKMSEMKFDMSGGAAVIEAIGAIARLRLPLQVIGVVGATENLPSGRAVKPGDIVTAANGKTIEVNNTDAEGRLVLADCLHHAISLGAERVVDLATLTGAVIVALGSTYAGLLSNDDELAAQIEGAGRRSGEIVWRLPLHAEYDELIKGRYGDLNNAPEERKAGTIVGATFLSNFVGETPWAHLDIAGSAWDLGRAYAPKSASGYGVRLLVELARSCAQG